MRCSCSCCVCTFYCTPAQVLEQKQAWKHNLQPQMHECKAWQTRLRDTKYGAATQGPSHNQRKQQQQRC